MTKKELVRVYVIKSLIESKMTSRDAAEVLSLGERQIKRLKADVKKDGEVAVRPAKVIPKEDRAKRSIKPMKVKDDHPWKNSGVEPNFTYEESDRELVAAIYDPKGWEQIAYLPGVHFCKGIPLSPSRFLMA